MNQDARVGQSLLHHKIIRKLGSGGMVWCTKLRTPSSLAVPENEMACRAPDRRDWTSRLT